MVEPRIKGGSVFIDSIQANQSTLTLHNSPMPSVDDVVLHEVFLKYCHFGTRNSSISTECSPIGARKSSITTPLLDGSKFAKLIRESGLLDDTITSTEVDILFSKVKDRGERRISFLQFRLALRMLAEKKPQGENDLETAEEQVLTAVRNVKAPQLSGTTLPENSETLDRLMEGPATYVGRSPNRDARSWKDDLRRASSGSQSSRRSSMDPAASSRKSSLNLSQLAQQNLTSMIKAESPQKSRLASGTQ